MTDERLILNMKYDILKLIKEKNVSIDLLSASLGLTNEMFENNLYKTTNDITFYLQTLNILENWEV